MVVEYIEFSQVGITLAVIAIACGFIKLVWDAVKAIHDWRLSLSKPTDDRIDDTNVRIDGVEKRLGEDEDRIAYLEGCCEEVHGKLNADWQFQQDEIEMNRLLLKSIKQLLKHSIDGNDTEGLAEMEGAIDAYLIDHAK